MTTGLEVVLSALYRMCMYGLEEGGTCRCMSMFKAMNVPILCVLETTFLEDLKKRFTFSSITEYPADYPNPNHPH